MLTAKSKFCKIMIAVLSCIALALAALGFTTLKKVSALEEGEMTLEIFATNGDFSNRMLRKQSGTHGDKSYEYVIQLGSTGKLTAMTLAPKKVIKNEETQENELTYMGGDIKASWTEFASTNPDFITGNGGDSAVYSFTQNGVGDAVISLTVYDSAEKETAYGTVNIYVSNKAPSESAYETHSFKMDSLTMVGDGVSQVHGTLSDEPYGVGISDNIQGTTVDNKDELRDFYDNFLYNGMTIQEMLAKGYGSNIHLNGPGSVRDFAIYHKWGTGSDAPNEKFVEGDTITFLKGFTLIKKIGNNKGAYLCDSDNKPFVMAATQMFRYDGSRFVAIKGVQSVSFEEKEVFHDMDDTHTYAAVVTPAAGAPADLDTSVTYSSNNTNVATVDATTGEITIKSFGEATITATSTVDGVSGSYNVYVANPDAKPENAIIENGNLFLVLGDYDFEDPNDGTYTTGYTASKSSEEGIDFEVVVNKVLFDGRAMQLRVRYGVDGGDYANLYNAEALSGYRIAEGDYTFASADDDVVSWIKGADAYLYSLNVNGVGTTTVTIKVWLPASDSKYTGFGEVAAKAYELGEITIKITVEEEDVSTLFNFTGARANKKCEVLIDFDGFVIGSAADNSWNNTENFNAGKATLTDWYNKILINGYTRDEWLNVTKSDEHPQGKNLNMHIRSEYLDFFQYSGSTECPFEDGDIITIEKGFRLLEFLGGGEFRYYHETTKNYFVLENTLMLKYDASAGATGAWVVITEVLDIEVNDVTNEEPAAVENGAHIEMAVGDVINLGAVAVIDEAAEDLVDGTLVWTVADATVASLTANDDGTYSIELLKEGKTTVTITAGNKTVSVTVGVEPAEPEVPENPSNPDDSSNPSNPSTPNPSEGNEEGKKSGCSGNALVAPICAVAGILLVAGAVALVKKSRKNS